MIYFFLILSVSILIFIYCWFVEPRRFQLRHLDVYLPWKFNRTLTVLHLSDLHFYNGRIESIPFIHSLTAYEVDLIFITGDLIENNSGIPLCVKALQPLKAKYGIYAVLGNHDYYHTSLEDIGNKTGSLPKNHERKQNDVTSLIEQLRNIGIRVLQNENLIMDIEGIPLRIAGMDDPYVKRDDLDKTFQGIIHDDACLLLVHSPEKHVEIANCGLADMVFCGHTHGGQVRIPGFGAFLTRTNAPRRFVRGLLEENQTQFYISTGLGSGPFTRPRFNCPPEAVLFQIHPMQNI